MAERIEIISAERIRDELTKLVLTDHPRPGLNLLVETGLAERVLPELPALRLEGPYLAIAGWLVFFWGDRMIDAYLRFSGLA